MKTFIKMFALSLLLAVISVLFINYKVIHESSESKQFRKEIEEQFKTANKKVAANKEKTKAREQHQQPVQKRIIPDDKPRSEYDYFVDDIFDYANYDAPRPLYSVLDPNQTICDGIENINMQEMLEFTKLKPQQRREIKLCEQFAFISTLITMDKYEILLDALNEPNMNLTVFAKVKNKDGIENYRTLLTQAILSYSHQSLDVLYHRLSKEDPETFNKIVYVTLMGLIKEPKTFVEKEARYTTVDYILYLIREGYADQLDKVLKNEISLHQVTEGVLHNVILRLWLNRNNYQIRANSITI